PVRSPPRGDRLTHAPPRLRKVGGGFGDPKEGKPKVEFIEDKLDDHLPCWSHSNINVARRALHSVINIPRLPTGASRRTARSARTLPRLWRPRAEAAGCAERTPLGERCGAFARGRATGVA